MKTSLDLDDINRTIKSADYHVFPGTTTTVCCLTLVDGFTVIGQSACIDPASFDEALGRSIAHDDALNKVWQLEGYLLNYKLKRGIAKAEVEDKAAADAAAAEAVTAAAAAKAAAEDATAKQQAADALAAQHAADQAALNAPAATLSDVLAAGSTADSSALSTDQVAALTTDAAPALTTDQVAALATAQFPTLDAVVDLAPTGNSGGAA